MRRALPLLGLALALATCQATVGLTPAQSSAPPISAARAPSAAPTSAPTEIATLTLELIPRLAPTPTVTPKPVSNPQPVSKPRSSPKPTATGGGRTILANVPQYYQLPMSCEETSLSMALVHQGLHVSTKQILRELGVDKTPITLTADGRHIATWGDPDQAFVGDVYGFAYQAPWGFFAYPNALVRVIHQFGGSIVAWSEPGVGPDVITASDIYHYIAAGHPVVAYATWDWKRHPIYYYTDEHGHKVPNIYPAFGHVYALYGVSATSVLLRDPVNGTYWVSKKVFAASYELGMAIVLK